MRRRRFRFFIVGLLLVICAFIFYFGYPQIWGSAIYPLKYEELIKKYAAQYNLSPSFIATIIYAESHFNPDAVSPAGAQGLMQIMPATGARLARTLGDTDFSLDKLKDPERNIRYGTYYCRELMDRYQGNIDKVLIAYNGGNGAVVGYERRGVLPRETQGYLRKIKGTWEMYEKIYQETWYSNNDLAKQKDDQWQKQLQEKINALKGKEEGLREYKGRGWEFKIFWPPIGREK